MINKDKVFRKKISRKTDFNFGKATTMVFDDMLERSVPFYDEMQRMIAEMARSFAQPNTNIYDLGCSTGTTLINIREFLPKEYNNRIIGIDNSEAMLESARKKIKKSSSTIDVDFKCVDLNHGISLNNASVIVMVLTLQFVRPLNREQLIRTIYDALRKNGVFILVEKVLGEDTLSSRVFIDLYHEFKKRRGYSDLEIAQKREALENVLVPYRINENIALLKRSGFVKTDIFFKWYNFCGILALK